MSERLAAPPPKSILQDPLEIVKRPLRGTGRWASKNKGWLIGGAIAYLLVFA
jgi:hypothetical protein